MIRIPRCTLALALVGLLLPTARTSAGIREVTVTVENLAPTNSISFAPLRVGFNNGTFDAFNNGQTATAPIISIAEGGSGSAWFPAFHAADPTATLGTVSPGPILPGTTASNTFTVDSSVNPFFTFAAMVVPSNDFFIGNDSPTRFRLFDTSGNLAITNILQKASDIWDAGSEAFDPLNAAFLVIGNNDLRTPQNGVVNFNFSELSGFNGLTTRGGYVFDSQLSSDTNVFRISFSATTVPEPASLFMAAIGVVGLAAVRIKRKK